MPYTYGRLLEEGWHQTGDKKHCSRCGMWLFCFVKDGRKRWLNSIERNGETVYQDHDIWICDGRRGRRAVAKSA
jgi:hypothetical protein